MAAKLKALPKGVKSVSPSDTGAVLLAAERIVWYDLGPCSNPHEKLLGKQLRCGDKHEIKAGTIFRSHAELKLKGLDQDAIDKLIAKRSLVYRSLEHFIRGSGNPFGRDRTPIVLGNTTGSDEGDKHLGIVQQNKPDVAFGYHPDNLKTKDLEELKALIAEADPSVNAPDSVTGCIEILTQNHPSVS